MTAVNRIPRFSQTDRFRVRLAGVILGKRLRVVISKYLKGPLTTW